MTLAKSAAPAHCDGGAGQELEHLAGRLKVQATPEAVRAQVSAIASIVISRARWGDAIGAIVAEGVP
jgi:hypothetical protein